MIEKIKKLFSRNYFKKYDIKKYDKFKENETWNLDYAIASFILPRLEMFIEISDKNVAWNNKDMKDLQDLKLAMKLVIKDNEGEILTENDRIAIKKGLETFPRIFEKLWW